MVVDFGGWWMVDSGLWIVDWIGGVALFYSVDWYCIGCRI